MLSNADKEDMICDNELSLDDLDYVACIDFTFLVSGNYSSSSFMWTPIMEMYELDFILVWFMGFNI